MKEEIERLYREKYLYAMAMNITHNKDRAEELVQDTVIRLYDNEHLYTEQDNLYGFIKTVMHRVHFNSIRRDEYKIKYDKLVKDVNQVQHQNTNNDTQVDYCYLMQLIDRVSDKQYLSFMLREYRCAEISRALNKDPSVALRRVRKIRKELSQWR